MLLFDQLESNSVIRNVFLNATVQKCRKHLLDAILSVYLDELLEEWELERIFSFAGIGQPFPTGVMP